MKEKIQELVELSEQLRALYSKSEDTRTIADINGYDAQIQLFAKWVRIYDNQDFASIRSLITDETAKIDKALLSDRNLKEEQRLRLMDRRDLFAMFALQTPVETLTQIKNLGDTIRASINYYKQNYQHND